MKWELDQVFSKISDAIMQAQTILVGGHVNPDGDCIGAALSMGLALQHMGKRVTVLLESLGQKYEYLPGKDLVKHVYNGQQADLYISLDCSSKDRLGQFEKAFTDAAVTINIDHHVSNTNYADINCIQDDASSTCELIYKFYSQFMPITKDMATAMYTGIVYDTGGFKHQNTTQNTFVTASKLIQMGVDSAEIINQLFAYTTFKELQLMGYGFSHMVSFAEGKGIYTFIPQEEVKRLQASVDEMDQIVQFLINVRGAQAAVFVRENEDGSLKVSLRSKSMDVAAFAAGYGGGGHMKAAGFTYTGPKNQESLKEEIITRISEQL